jgi:fatty acid desaturase
MRELLPALRHEVFEPAPHRLLWLPVHLGLAALATIAIARGWVPWAVAPLLSVVIGTSFACLTFLAHETLHGAVTRNRRLARAVGFVGFLPFAVSPRLWVAWHNRVHHRHANQPGVDPDAFPTLEEYRQSARQRYVTDHFAPGGGRWTGLLGLILGFSIQTASVLVFAQDEGRRTLTRREHRRAIAETALGLSFWGAIAVWVGPLAFLFAFVVPLLVANAIVMSHIFTNHGLSQHLSVNDPLAHSLSVTTPRWIEWITLGFGFHVEHHLFPWMSSRHSPIVRALLRARWPDRYQSMPLGRALLALHRGARVYKNDTTLCDPRTGREWPTLGATRSTSRTEVEKVQERVQRSAAASAAVIGGSSAPTR